ncbi:MAG: hypothetical protein O2856_04030 [Planctomycetota bacterium]|nr:hypothetical protein [Planctomycetota bacterium]
MTEGREYHLVLPTPHKILHAHNTGNKFKRAPVVKSHRELAWAESKLIYKQNYPIKNAYILYSFFVPDNRRRDTANMVHMCKPYIDGLVDAGMIVDDCWQHLRMIEPMVAIDRTNPRVEFLIGYDDR